MVTKAFFQKTAEDRGRESISETEGESETEVEVTLHSIAVPGYEALTMKADTVKQEISLENPKSNPCYFVISMILEDGTKIWESEYIAPGGRSSPITLTEPLEKGRYENTKLSLVIQDDTSLQVTFKQQGLLQRIITVIVKVIKAIFG